MVSAVASGCTCRTGRAGESIQRCVSAEEVIQLKKHLHHIDDILISSDGDFFAADLRNQKD